MFRRVPKASATTKFRRVALLERDTVLRYYTGVLPNCKYLFTHTLRCTRLLAPEQIASSRHRGDATHELACWYQHYKHKEVNLLFGIRVCCSIQQYDPDRVAIKLVEFLVELMEELPLALYPLDPSRYTLEKSVESTTFWLEAIARWLEKLEATAQQARNPT